MKEALQGFAGRLVLPSAASTAEGRMDLFCRACQGQHWMLTELMGNMFRNELAPQKRN